MPDTSCPFIPSAFWTRDIPQQTTDFILVNNNPAHSGTSSALFFFGPIAPGPYIGSTLTYALPLNAVPGKTYVVSFFHTLSDITPNPLNFNGPVMSVLWNGVPIINVEQSGVSNSPDAFFNTQAEVVATGGDTFVLQDGISYEHRLYVDDIAVFEKWF